LREYFHNLAVLDMEEHTALIFNLFITEYKPFDIPKCPDVTRAGYIMPFMSDTGYSFPYSQYSVDMSLISVHVLLTKHVDDDIGVFNIH